MSEGLRDTVPWPKPSKRVRFIKRWCANSTLELMEDVCCRIIGSKFPQVLSRLLEQYAEEREAEPGSHGEQGSLYHDDGRLMADAQVVVYCLRCDKCMKTLATMAAYRAMVEKSDQLTLFAICANFDFDDDVIRAAMRSTDVRSFITATAQAKREDLEIDSDEGA